MQWKSINADQQKRFSTLRYVPCTVLSKTDTSTAGGHCRERICLIEKDVIRTDRTRTFYKDDDNLGLKLLSDILKTYCMHNFDLGKINRFAFVSHVNQTCNVQVTVSQVFD